MARRIQPEGFDEETLTRENRLRLQRRGSFMPSETGVSGGTFFNPARIAGRQPEGAGVVGPDYRQRLADREEAARRAKFQGSPMTATREQGDATFDRMRAGSASRQEQFDYEAEVARHQTQMREQRFTSPSWEVVDREVSRVGGGGGGVPLGYAGRGGLGSAGRGTPQQRAQNWSDVNTAANAEIVPKGGTPTSVPKFNLFGGGDHLDSAMLAMGRDSVNKEDWKAYQVQTKLASAKLQQALATRSSVPATVEEAQQFIDSLGFDDRVGQHIENEMMNYIMKAAPDLARQLIGEQKADQANDSSYVQWVKRNATDPEIARATTADILDARTPENEREWEMDINSDKFEFDPVTGQPQKKPPVKLTPIEEAQQLKKNVQTIADQSGGQLQVRWRMGKPENVSVEELTKERTEDIDKQIVIKEKAIDRTKDIITMDGDESGELGLRLTRYNNDIDTLLLERDGLEAGATPAAQAPAAGAAQPIPSQDKIGEITAGLQRTDLTIQEREYLQQKLQQLQPQGAPAPAGGKGSITMGGKTVTRAGVAPKPGTGSITRAGETATNVPAVKPVAPAAPYVAPITKVQDMLAREPVTPKPLPSKEPTAPPTKYSEFSPEIRAQVEKETPPDVSTSRILKDIGKSAGKKLINTTVKAAKDTAATIIEAPEVVSDAVVWYLKVPWTEAKFIAKFGVEKLDEVLEPRKQAILEEWKLDLAKKLSEKGEK